MPREVIAYLGCTEILSIQLLFGFLSKSSSINFSSLISFTFVFGFTVNFGYKRFRYKGFSLIRDYAKGPK